MSFIDYEQVKVVYFENELFKIVYHKDIHVVSNAWITPPSSDEFREGMNQLINAMQHFKAGKLVSDTTHVGAIFLNDQEWVVTDWHKRAEMVGFTHSAIVIPSDIFAEMSVKGIVDNVSQPIVRSYFDNMDKAFEWIKQF